MPSYLFYDTLRLNPGAGGVLNVSEVLLRSMRLSPGERVESVSERHPRLFALARRLKLSRFLLETLIYNAHRLGALVSGRQVFSVFPNYFLPFAPFGRHRDSIVIVHDLQYRTFPENFGRIKCLWLDWSLRRAARSLADVVFISRSSQQDFERHIGRCLRPAVIYSPVDAAGAGTLPDAPPKDGRYLIAAYHYYPHKNFVGTLRLFERMKREGLVDWLNITGNGAADVERMVDGMAPALRGCVRHRGLVPRDELLRLYRGATAFISLSTFEGFNLSAAEAATLGVPLLLSDIPAHRELFGNCSFFIGSEPCDLGRLSLYLAAHRQARPAWSNAPACMPAAVAGRYLALKRRAVSFNGATT